MIGRHVVVGLAAAAFASVTAGQDRAAAPARYKWDLSEIYASDAAWDASRADLAADVAKLTAAKRERFATPAELFDALALQDRIGERASRVSVYANLRRDIDTRDGRGQQMREQAREARVAATAAAAWIRPAILALGADGVRTFVARDPRLVPYRHPLDDALRYAGHTLDVKGETLFAQTDLFANTGESVFSVFTNAEMPWPTVALANGEKVLLDTSAYEKLRESPNRDDRIAVFKAFWTAYGHYSATLGATLNGQIQAHAFRKTARNFGSSLEASLFEDNIPVAVYSQLVADARRNLPTLHRYLRLRARLLGLADLRYEDLYTPIVPTYVRSFTPDDAATLVVRAVAPLGREYASVLEAGLAARWTDWYPAPGKRSGAYSTMVYGLHPFQLQNFTGKYAEVSTLAHESGHSMHSYLAARAQPHATWRYPTFIAEVASTLNENLLVQVMLAQAQSDDERLFLLGSELELLRQTLFRQVLFAEFELHIHDRVEKGEPLTGENLKALYLDLVRTYYGHDAGVCTVDALYANEWTYVAHFYYDFYVFQYATSVVASMALADGIREEARVGGTSARRDGYLGMLRAGGSKYAYDMLRDAGVDLATPAPFDAAMREMNAIMDRIEAIVAARAPAAGTESRAPAAAVNPGAPAAPDAPAKR
ncbi:MAG TPA: M3 family oligoendopeptidase [Casimicrobiaceae bacterium]|nr:M3 family oligoendopeptidase [Casimicrobiaceae bacterium]